MNLLFSFNKAAQLLVNLTSQPMPSGNTDNAANAWQGPIVRNEQTQVKAIRFSNKNINILSFCNKIDK